MRGEAVQLRWQCLRAGNDEERVGQSILRLDEQVFAAGIDTDEKVFRELFCQTTHIAAIASAEIEGMPGISAVITHLNAPRLPYGPHKSYIDPAIGERLHVLQDERVRFHGQPVAIVVAGLVAGFVRVLDERTLLRAAA